MEDDGGCRRSGSNVTTPPDCAPIEKTKARNDDHGYEEEDDGCRASCE